MNKPNVVTGSARLDHQSLEDRFALRVAAALSTHADSLPGDVTERLRFAREQALVRARQAVARTAPTPTRVGGGVLAWGGEPGWGWRLATLAPLIALVAGLVLIQIQHDDDQISAAAEVDAALLADDLPPAAYTDAGFAEFLRLPGSTGND
ncbi:DUF3619 family protein [Methylibium sp.]|jgi:hypothetical protein|uniref:DUF3619 family protein n=1 Tax=Methylibium sp. TaxID=2067992 RepID=UPI003D0FFCE1